MRLNRLGLALATACTLAISAHQASAATVVGAKTVTITSALNDASESYYDPSQAYIQVSELVADNFASTDVALSSNGATATAASNYQGADYTGKAIDGVYPQDYPNIYHSAGTGTNEFLTVTFASAANLSSLSIYGRGDPNPAVGTCCEFRDVYNYAIYNSAGGLITSGQLDARNANHVASITFGAASGTPEPASWALMIGGFGMAGAVLRRRRTAVSA